ncbi:MAG TPA: lysophospholipid transporter LplT [Burkholderiaceae bacterium]|nr:lysophospholipid transporter LplT [Burkholderiaceae bacterium]
MGRGFYTIMAAQFFSSLADNALLVAAIELLKASQAPSWHVAALAPMFALFYVVLAPFVGAIADAYPKGQVMFVSNFIKVVGCLLMLFGGHPLMAYAIVGLGAAAYSPAKYGILTELLPASLLVKANGWIEGLTVASIILGILLGGILIGSHASNHLLSFDFPFLQTSVDTPAEAAIAVMILIYAIAAWFNTRIPTTGAQLIPVPPNKLALLPDFWTCNMKLWKDKLGQISLSTTTLFWGVLGNLRVIVFAWAAVALGYTTSQASTLVGVIVIGTAIGAVAASMTMTLDRATKLIPLGIIMGVLMLGLNFITHISIAIPFLILLGGLAGYLVVPMNALLQHRGHNLMGAGRSIAVQNFNEQACILGLGLLYALGTRLGMTAFGAIASFGILIAGVMWLIKRWHDSNCRNFPAEEAHLIDIATHDGMHD